MHDTAAAVGGEAGGGHEPRPSRIATLTYNPLEPGTDLHPLGFRVHWMRNLADCFPCCVATLLGCAYEDVPGHRPDLAPGPGMVARYVASGAAAEYSARFDAWLAERGFAAVTRTLDLADRDQRRDLSRRLWIGGDRHPDGGHCVLMLGLACVFDPVLGFEHPDGLEPAPMRGLDVAVTMDRIEVI